MNCSRTEISILFDEPFWIALFEHFEEGYYRVARKIMGTSEPTGAEIKIFFEELNVDQLQYTSPMKECARKYPKRHKFLQRQNKKITELSSSKYVFTKAQHFLKQQRSEIKISNNQEKHKNKELDKHEKYGLKQQKRKEKLRGH